MLSIIVFVILVIYCYFSDLLLLLILSLTSCLVFIMNIVVIIHLLLIKNWLSVTTATVKLYVEVCYVRYFMSNLLYLGYGCMVFMQ